MYIASAFSLKKLTTALPCLPAPTPKTDPRDYEYTSMDEENVAASFFHAFLSGCGYRYSTMPPHQTTNARQSIHLPIKDSESPRALTLTDQSRGPTAHLRISSWRDWRSSFCGPVISSRTLVDRTSMAVAASARPAWTMLCSGPRGLGLGIWPKCDISPST